MVLDLRFVLHYFGSWVSPESDEKVSCPQLNTLLFPSPLCCFSSLLVIATTMEKKEGEGLQSSATQTLSYPASWTQIHSLLARLDELWDAEYGPGNCRSVLLVCDFARHFTGILPFPPVCFSSLRSFPPPVHCVTQRHVAASSWSCTSYSSMLYDSHTFSLPVPVVSAFLFFRRKKNSLQGLSAWPPRPSLPTGIVSSTMRRSEQSSFLGKWDELRIRRVCYTLRTTTCYVCMNEAHTTNGVTNIVAVTIPNDDESLAGTAFLQQVVMCVSTQCPVLPSL